MLGKYSFCKQTWVLAVFPRFLWDKTSWHIQTGLSQPNIYSMELHNIG